MSSTRIITLFFSLFLFCANAFAQNNTIIIDKKGEKVKGHTSSALIGRTGVIGSKVDANSIPAGYGKFSDDKLKELEEEMKERDWNKEETAWVRASELDTEEAYTRYLAMYPYGIHRGDADKRIIDLRIMIALNSAHNELPGIKHVESDEDSPTSTVVINNCTEYPLTVMYSGDDTKSIIISVGHKATITVNNGDYSIAASVPDTKVRPYAGTTVFSGGRYETSFYVVRY